MYKNSLIPIEFNSTNISTVQAVFKYNFDNSVQGEPNTTYICLLICTLFPVRVCLDLPSNAPW